MGRRPGRDKPTVTIGGEIKELLTKKGITAYRLGTDLGIDQSYLSRVLRNQINPSYEFTKRMLNYLGYDICFVKIKSQKKGGETRKLKIR